MFRMQIIDIKSNNTSNLVLLKNLVHTCKIKLCCCLSLDLIKILPYHYPCDYFAGKPSNPWPLKERKITMSRSFDRLSEKNGAM